MIKAAFAALAVLAMAKGAAAEPVRLHAAGSLRDALTEVARAFDAAPGGVSVEAKFGPSGLLRDAIAGGERAEVFASANTEHPASLTRAGKAGPTVLFARNRLCALVRAGLQVSTESLVERLLDPTVKVGTSTPKADPSGDYAFEVFGRMEALRPGSRTSMEAKALQLTGGPNSPKPSPGRSLYGEIVARGDADLFLTYCTNAQAAAREVPGAAVVALPEPLAVGADYGLAVMAGASEPAYRFALFVLSDEGQAILARHGFTAPLRAAGRG